MHINALCFFFLFNWLFLCWAKLCVRFFFISTEFNRGKEWKHSTTDEQKNLMVFDFIQLVFFFSSSSWSCVCFTFSQMNFILAQKRFPKDFTYYYGHSNGLYQHWFKGFVYMIVSIKSTSNISSHEITSKSKQSSNETLNKILVIKSNSMVFLKIQMNL